MHVAVLLAVVRPGVGAADAQLRGGLQRQHGAVGAHHGVGAVPGLGEDAAHGPVLRRGDVRGPHREQSLAGAHGVPELVIEGEERPGVRSRYVLERGGLH